MGYYLLFKFIRVHVKGKSVIFCVDESTIRVTNLIYSYTQTHISGNQFFMIKNV